MYPFSDNPKIKKQFEVLTVKFSAPTAPTHMGELTMSGATVTTRGPRGAPGARPGGPGRRADGQPYCGKRKQARRARGAGQGEGARQPEKSPEPVASSAESGSEKVRGQRRAPAALSSMRRGGGDGA